MTKIDAQGALALLEKIVEYKGADHTASCYYSNLDENQAGYGSMPERVQPICIVGHAIFRAGGEEKLKQMPTAVNIMDTQAQAVARSVGFTPEAIEVLYAAQHVQDFGYKISAANEFIEDGRIPVDKDQTWGAALSAAREVVEGGKSA